MALLAGFDVGSSSVKASLLDAETGRVVASAVSPEREMKISAPKPGWAEQNPEGWWKHLCAASKAACAKAGRRAADVAAVGIAYQMHGLVLVDKAQKVLRPSIIWCDSRAVETGRKAAEVMGVEYCLRHLLNLPGNFTASKLAWVRRSEPEVYIRVHRMMLPGDYIAMKMTDEINTTISGLSEGIYWDFLERNISDKVLGAFGLNPGLIPGAHASFGAGGVLSKKAALQLGLPAGIPVSYRAGDQPNNAFSLNVMEPGEIAATAGTSGVIYGVGDKPVCDPASRVNTFVHVNDMPSRPRYGTLMCVNGTGILYSWLKANAASGMEYAEMNRLAGSVPAGSDGLTVLPYGNGAERTLSNEFTGVCVSGLQLTRHGLPHLLRAAQEGIAFALHYGLLIMRGMGIAAKTVKAGEANLFQSPVFRQAFVNTTGAALELYETDGAQGAARGAGLGAGIFRNESEAFRHLVCRKSEKPQRRLRGRYADAYARWVAELETRLEIQKSNNEKTRAPRRRAK